MRPTPSSGFTLIEALVVIALAAILVAVGVPSFRSFTANRAVSAHVSDLASALRLARTEAIKRGIPVTVCRTGDANAAQPTCSNGGDWSSGWLVFVDRETRGQVDDGDVVIRVQQGYGNSGGITRAGSAFLTFLPSGIAPGVAGSFLLRPNIPEGDPNYERLSKMMCTNFTGATRLAEGLVCAN
ncbi:GspH/FimT family pseudopilin [Caldimonas caldifontis]|uniref:Type II secretion system protein H n=1 Tax=Caldimonas caldifontis TaxID=1452508 RepID=A0A2S5SWZ3_9BURK|nr:GspH/FimT family pseudopilin [Caldimonas caldifontis]PPE67169.1 pilus assembly protein [Caldimonas caldifontis]